ncbi:DNA polymerase III subunit delta [Patescibacteria group bacterium]|nr:MAG: DNA polymerase III subunit delta [Patescibacteria group bacterium]
MVILVHGEDGYRVAQKRDELVTAFRAKFDQSGMNVDLRDGSALSPEELSSAVRTQPFLASRRLVVVKGLFSRKGEKAMEPYAAALAAHDAEQLIVVLSDVISEEAVAKHPLRKALQKALPKSAIVEYGFPPLAPGPLRAWIAEEAARAGRQIMSDAAELLAVSVGPDLWRMSGEVAKLAAWRSDVPIMREDVALLVERHLEENAFAFTDAVGAGDTRAGATLLERELAAGNDAFALLAMLIRQARLLAAARSLIDAGSGGPEALASSFGVHPFVAKKTFAQARALSAVRVRRFHDALLNADAGIKRGRFAAEDALRQILAQCV